MCKQAGKPAWKTLATDIQDVAIVCLQQRSSICQHKAAGVFFGALYDARFTLKYFKGCFLPFQEHSVPIFPRLNMKLVNL